MAQLLYVYKNLSAICLALLVCVLTAWKGMRHVIFSNVKVELFFIRGRHESTRKAGNTDYGYNRLQRHSDKNKQAYACLFV